MSRWEQSGGARGDDYDARWRALEAAGKDIHGEAEFVASYSPATVLDAGCGTGRVAIELARRGITTAGVDRDPAMLDTARRNGPGTRWVEADLSSFSLDDRFDVVVTAGNVMIFLDPGTEAAVVANLAAHLAPGGRLVAGFQLTTAYGLEHYDADCTQAGLHLAERYATWEKDPWPPGGDYAVSVHQRE